MTALAANLKTLRGNRTRIEFAQFLAIRNQETYNSYEAGKIAPSTATLQRLGKLLGITPEDLAKPLPRATVEITTAKCQSSTDGLLLLSLGDAGRRLGLSDTSMRWLIADGEFVRADVARKGSKNRAWRLTEKSVNAFILRRIQQARCPKTK